MPILFLVLFIASSFFPVAPSRAAQGLNPKNDKTIQWVVQDLPPFIKTDPADQLEVDMSKAQGPVASMFRQMATAIPGYEHRYLKIPFMRAENLFKDKKQFCTALLQKSPEREKFLHFGEEIAIALPVGLIVQKNLPPEKYSMVNGVVDMEKTLSTKKFGLGVVKGRFYTTALSPLIAEDHGSYSIVSDGTATGLLTMLSNSRLDGVLGYYLEMIEFERLSPKTPKLQWLKIKQAADYLELRVSCEKSPWGEKALQAISKAIRDKNFKEQAHQYFLSALPPERRKDYQKLYDDRPSSK